MRVSLPGSRDGAAAIALFLLASIVRLRFHGGFVLGDDAEEFQLIRSMVVDGVGFEGHLRYRVPMWLFNYLSERAFGNYEAAFFLPTWLLSSLLPVLAYLTLRSAAYGRGAALFAGALVAFSPFEVLIGGLRANDLFAEFFLACALWAFVRWQHAPRVQAATVALTFWLAFYAKLWSAFLYPVVAVHYVLRSRRHGDWRALSVFVWTSLVLHAVTCVFWRLTVGTWVPFITQLSATYPVPADQLRTLFLTYPRLIVAGSEHGNSLFGILPYLVVCGLVLKALGATVPALVARAPRMAFDRYDKWLLWSCLVFFALLNFFPNAFTFDRYYSVPRIFRYLAPLSYGLSLLAAKHLVDAGSYLPARFALREAAAIGALLIVAGGIDEAVGPSRAHRTRLTAIREHLRATCPPTVIIEGWQALFFRELHLPEACPDSTVQSAGSIYQSRDHERWLQRIQPGLARDAVLVTGLIQFVYYASHTDGFRLGGFDRPLDGRWRLVRELDPLPFDKAREPIRLWRWDGTAGPEPVAEDVPALAPAQLFERGIQRFDAEDYPGTRAWMLAVVGRFPDDELSDDAAYFAAVTYWREQNASRTIQEFQRLADRFPDSRWVGAAYYHIGLSHRMMGRQPMARTAFEAAVSRASPDSREYEYALAALDAMRRPAPLAALGRHGTELLYAFQARVDALGRGP